MEYSYKKQVELSFDKALEKTKIELGHQGFGVLTEINVKETLHKKINADFNEYVILGACSPTHAYQVLKIEVEIGLFLPCNLIVYQDDSDKIFVSTMLPNMAMRLINNPNLDKLSAEIEEKLKKVIDSI